MPRKALTVHSVSSTKSFHLDARREGKKEITVTGL